MNPGKPKQWILRRCFYPAFIFYMIVLFSGFCLAQNDQESVVILQTAELTIDGQTNINSFSCHMGQLHLNDTLAKIVNTKTDLSRVFEGLEIVFKVDEFKCDLALMTKDLRRSLKEEEFPFIRMQIDEVYLKSLVGKQWKEAVTAYIFLNIAGEKSYEFVTDAKIERNRDKFTFSGTYQLHMTDFKITPPTKMLGTVRTKDLVKIDFSIALTLQ